MHGATLLDASIACCARLFSGTMAAAAEECALLEGRVPTSREITGNLMMPGLPRQNCCGCSATN
jgi:xylulokinase